MHFGTDGSSHHDKAHLWAFRVASVPKSVSLSSRTCREGKPHEHDALEPMIAGHDHMGACSTVLPKAAVAMVATKRRCTARPNLSLFRAVLPHATILSLSVSGTKMVLIPWGLHVTLCILFLLPIISPSETKAWSNPHCSTPPSNICSTGLFDHHLGNLEPTVIQQAILFVSAISRRVHGACLSEHHCGR